MSRRKRNRNYVEEVYIAGNQPHFPEAAIRRVATITVLTGVLGVIGLAVASETEACELIEQDMAYRINNETVETAAQVVCIPAEPVGALIDTVIEQ